jgi:hypothetical protein
MKDQNAVFQGCQIEDAKCSGRFSNSDFLDAGSDRLHGLPIIGIVAALDKFKLPAGLDARLLRKRTNIRPTASKPFDQLHGCIVSITIHRGQRGNCCREFGEE